MAGKSTVQRHHIALPPEIMQQTRDSARRLMSPHEPVRTSMKLTDLAAVTAVLSWANGQLQKPITGE